MTTDQKLWPVGLAVAFIGSISGAVGDNMVRLDYMEAGPHLSLQQMFRRWKWLFGMFLTTVVDVLCVLVALAMAPATIITPFAGVHVFWNIFLAKFWLREEVGLWEIIGSSVIIIGVVLIVVFAGKSLNLSSLQFLPAYLSTPQAIAYLTFMFFAVLWCIVLATNTGATHLLPSRIRHPAQRLAVAATSGLLAGNTNIAAKVLMIVGVQLYAGDTSVLFDYWTYLVVIVTVVLAVSQLIYLNLGLRRYEAIYVVPTVNSCLIGSGNVGAVLILKEYPIHWPMFFLGLVAAVGGVFALVFTHTSRDISNVPASCVQLKTTDSLELELGHVESQSQPASPVVEPSPLHKQITAQLSSGNDKTLFVLPLNPSSPQPLHRIQSVQEIYKRVRLDGLLDGHSVTKSPHTAMFTQHPVVDPDSPLVSCNSADRPSSSSSS